MAYMSRGGRNGVAQLTISTWLKVDQSALDDAFNNGNPVWGQARSRFPILTLGTSKDGGTAGGTGHVESYISVAVGGEDMLTAIVNGGSPSPGFSGGPYTQTGAGGNDPLGTSFDNTPGISGTLTKLDHNGNVIGTLSWDFSGILYLGHPPSGIVNNNPFNQLKWSLHYSFDVTYDTSTIALAPSALYLDSANAVNFLAAEDAPQRQAPFQNFWTFSEFTNAFVTDTSWNHVYFAGDLSDSSAVNWTMIVNFADKTVYTDSFTFPPDPGLHSIGGEQLGFPITPQEVAKHFSIGLNPNIRYAYTQIWFSQYIEPTDANLAKFAVISGSSLIPPTDKFAASNAFGSPDIYAYRDKNANVQFQNGFSVSGSAPIDYTPGPGQSATGDSRLRLGDSIFYART